MKRRLKAFLTAALLCIGFGSGQLAVTASAAEVHPGYNYVGVVRVKVGDTVNLRSRVGQYDSEEERYTMGAITWKSLLTEIATVDANGVATGVKPGSTRVTARWMNNAGESFDETILLRVERAEGPIKVEKTKHDATFTMFVNQNINYSQLVPAEDITWSVRDKTVLAVKKDGEVTGAGIGKTVMTATYRDENGEEQSMTFQVKVTGNNHYNSPRDDTITLQKGQELDLLEMFYPRLTEASRTHLQDMLKVSSSNSKVVRVDGYTVTARAAGTGKVTIKYEDFTSNGYRGDDILTIRVVG